jgi:hypothetical protein
LYFAAKALFRARSCGISSVPSMLPAWRGSYASVKYGDQMNCLAIATATFCNEKKVLKNMKKVNQ